MVNADKSPKCAYLRGNGVAGSKVGCGSGECRLVLCEPLN